MKNRKIKLYTGLIILLCCSFFLLSCTGISESAETDHAPEINKLNIVTTIFPYYDFVRQIAGDHVNLTMLLPAGMESHSFEPTPEDIIRLQNADIIIYNGGNMEAWMPEVLDAIDTSQIRILSMMDSVDLVEEEHVPGMQKERDETDAPEDMHGRLPDVEYDEHIWTSPRNAALIVRTIADVLKETDQENETDYANREAAYEEQLTALDQEFAKTVKEGKRKEIILGDRFPLRYFTDAYGLDYSAAFAGCSTDTEPSVATIAYLVKQVEEQQIPVVYYLELSSHKVADSICEMTGAKALLFHSCHNVTREELEAGVTYLGLMQQNVVNLREGLN